MGVGHFVFGRAGKYSRVQNILFFCVQENEVRRTGFFARREELYFAAYEKKTAGFFLRCCQAGLYLGKIKAALVILYFETEADFSKYAVLEYYAP